MNTSPFSKLVLFLLALIAMMIIGLALSSCRKSVTIPDPKPQTFEVKVEGINEDSTIAGESPVAVFYTNTEK